MKQKPGPKRLSQSSSKHLQALFTKADQLTTLKQTIVTFCPSLNRYLFEVGSYANGQLSLVTQNSATATQLKFQQPLLQRRLKRSELFIELSSIQIRVDNNTKIKTPPKAEISKSQIASQHLVAEAEATDDPTLKAALLKLAKRYAP